MCCWSDMLGARVQHGISQPGPASGQPLLPESHVCVEAVKGSSRQAIDVKAST